MTKSATDTMRDIIAAAVIDGVMALKDGAKGLPNAIARDVMAIHVNTSVRDLPEGVQKAIDESVRTAFTRLKKEGYTVAESGSVRPPLRRDVPPSPGVPRPLRPSNNDAHRRGRADRPSRPTGPPGSGKPKR
jgi:hypothetical protein